MTVVFSVLKHTIGLRASAEEETRGLDVTEHNLASSYADFMPMVFTGAESGEAEKPVSVEKAVTVEHFPEETPQAGDRSAGRTDSTRDSCPVMWRFPTP